MKRTIMAKFQPKMIRIYNKIVSQLVILCLTGDRTGHTSSS